MLLANQLFESWLAGVEPLKQRKVEPCWIVPSRSGQSYCSIHTAAVWLAAQEKHDGAVPQLNVHMQINDDTQGTGNFILSNTKPLSGIHRDAARSVS